MVQKVVTVIFLLFAGKGNVPIKLTARRTIPLVEDECVLGTSAVVPIGGLTY